MDYSADELARRQQERNQVRLAVETKSEWHTLKRLVSQFALDKQGIGDDRFRLSKSISDQPRLSLGNVSATFVDRGQLDGIPRHCRVLFAHNVVAIGTDSRNQTWSLTPEIVGGRFEWSVRETGKKLSSALLADEIATELTRYHLIYDGQAHKTLT